MVDKRFVDPIILLLVLIHLLLPAAGCQGPMKKQILSFFFTGIEPVEKEESPVEKKKSHPETTKPAAPAVKERMLQPEKISFSHGPYAAGLCSECHQTDAFIPAQTEGQDRRNRLPRLKAGPPGMLAAPPEVLCTICHESMSSSHAQSEGLWLHGPAVQGNCTFCHHPHQSPNMRMLIEPSERVCIQCHEGSLSIGSGQHAESGRCLSCHNPHFGKTRFLLKADYREEQYPFGSRAGSGIPQPERSNPGKKGVPSGSFN